MKKLLLYPIYTLLVVIVGWLLWSALAYRDIPVEVLEQRYGGDDLQQVTIDGVDLRYRVAGSGPALLLIHSHYFSMRMWDQWVPQLSDHFTVIRFDMTSHGLTGPEPDADYSMDRDLQLIEGLLDHLAVDSFSVVGSSLGGNMAFHLAARYPQRITHLVLMNSGGIPKPNSRASSGTIPGWVDYASYLVPTAAFRSFLEWMIIDDALVTPAMATEFHQMFRREGNRFAEFARLRAFDAGNPEPVLAAITAPTLIMWGEDNPQLPLAQVADFQRLLVAAERVETRTYPGVGHVLPLEQVKQGASDLREFLLAPAEAVPF